MLRRYNELAPSELSNPQEYLELPQNQKYLRSFSRFYNCYGPMSDRKFERPIDDQEVTFPIFAASFMTRTQDRSALILRSSQSEFEDITYRVFMYTFEDESGTKTEYKMVSNKFGIVDGYLKHQSARYMQFEFEKKGGYDEPSIPINDHHITLTLGENDDFPNRMTTNGNYVISLDYMTNLTIPACEQTIPATAFGRLALQREIAA